MDANHSAQEASRLFRVFTTVTKMLSDRGYVADHINREEFDQMSRMKSTIRESIQLFTFQQTNENDTIFVFFIDKPKFSKDDLQLKIELMKNNKDVKKAIFVLTGENSINPSDFGNELHLEFFKEEELLVNITQHELVPQHILISKTEKDELIKR